MPVESARSTGAKDVFHDISRIVKGSRGVAGETVSGELRVGQVAGHPWWLALPRLRQVPYHLCCQTPRSTSLRPQALHQ